MRCRFAWLVLLVASGCISTMKNGDLAAIRPQSEATRVGQVYLIRGLIGLFSVGIDRLGDEVNADGIAAHVYQATQSRKMADAIVATYGPAARREPLCLIGHSVGAEDVITIARKLNTQGIPVDLLVCMDATNPDKVPPNVRQCVNYYQSSIMDHLPILRGLPLEVESGFYGDFENLNVRKARRDLLEWDTNHFNIDQDAKIHADILRRLNAVCLPRTAQATTQAVSAAGDLVR